MAYKSGELIDDLDMGKTLTNGNAEIANYNYFAVTAQANSNRFTFLFIKTSNNLYKYFSALDTTGNKERSYLFQITLSGTTFSITGTCNHSTVSCSIYQIRGIC